MKVIQHSILTFFDTYYALQPHLARPSLQPASPSNKLKCLIDPTNFALAPQEKTDKDTDYKQRKAKAVAGFERLVQVCTIDERHKELYADKKKHDDLADCVLQAIYELQVHACRLRATQERQAAAEEASPPTKRPPAKRRRQAEASPAV